jgi:uncharacterized protein YecT (DUF1311 family)
MMQLFRFSLLAITAIITLMPVAMPLPALAHDGQVRPVMTRAQCLDSGDAHRGVMSAMFECEHIELTRLDVILNKIYKSARQTLTPAQSRQLQLLERRWITHRDQQCDAEQVETGEQDGILMWYICQIQETEKRIQWLKSHYVVSHPLAGK